jgi:hypothetical protein
MLTLAAAEQIGQATATVANIFTRVDALAHPDDMLKQLHQLPIVLAAIFVAVGMVCMLRGFKLYKGVVIAVALFTGLAVGYQLGKVVEAEMIVAGCLGVLLAVVAWPLMKYAVAAAGGIAGAFIGANAWAALAFEMSKRGTHMIDTPWVGALIGMMLMGLLVFILFELSVVLFTSFSGSVLAVVGIIALLVQVPSWQQPIESGLVGKPLILPMLVLVPAVIALVIQHQGGGFQKVSKPGMAGAAAGGGGKK